MSQPPRQAPTDMAIDYRVALVEKDVAVNTEKLANLIKDTEKFVSKSEFWPVKTLVYGMTAPVLLAVIAALVKLVIK